VCVRVCASVACYISEDEAQEALLSNVSERCCYGKAAASEMEIYQIISSCALHVRTSHSHYALVCHRPQYTSTLVYVSLPK